MKTFLNGLSDKAKQVILASTLVMSLSACQGDSNSPILGGRRTPDMQPGNEQDIASTLPISTASMKAPQEEKGVDDAALNPTPYDSIGAGQNPKDLKDAPVDKTPASQRRAPAMNQQAMEEIQGGGVVNSMPMSAPVTSNDYPVLASVPPAPRETPMDDSIQRKFDALMAQEKSKEVTPEPVASMPPPMREEPPMAMTPPPPAYLPPAELPRQSSGPINTMPTPQTAMAEPMPAPAPAPMREPEPAYIPPPEPMAPAEPMTASSSAKEPINLVPPPPEVASVPYSAAPASGDPIVLKQPTAQGGTKYRLIKESRYASRRINQRHGVE